MKLTRNQKILIVVLPLVIMAAGLIVALRTGDEGPKTGSIEASPYSCVWEKQNRSTLILSFDGELPEQAQWSLVANSGVIDATQQDNSSLFMVKSLSAGEGFLTVRLRDAGLPVESGADFDFTFSVDKRNNLSVTLSTVKILQADKLSSESGTQVCWRRSSTGAFFVYLTGTDWYVESCQGVDYNGPTVNEDKIRMEITNPDEALTGKIVIISSESGKGVDLDFVYKNNRLELTACSDAEAAEEEPEEPDPEYQAFLDALEKAETEEEKDLLSAQYWLKATQLTEQAIADAAPD